jgi:hypothetical protein
MMKKNFERKKRLTRERKRWVGQQSQQSVANIPSCYAEGMEAI